MTSYPTCVGVTSLMTHRIFGPTDVADLFIWPNWSSILKFSRLKILLFEIFEISLSTYIFPPLSGDECDQVRKLNYHVGDYFVYALFYFRVHYPNYIYLEQGKVKFSKVLVIYEMS